MIAKPILDKFEIKGIQNISTFENRALIEHRVPGMGGSLFQDLGTEPTLITVRGSLSYIESRQDVLNLEELRKKFQAAQPVPFVADITTATSVKEVFIKDIEIRESEELSGYFDYFIELKENIPEPQPSDVQASIDNKAMSGFDGMVKFVVAESSLKSTLMEYISPGSLNDFLNRLDKLGTIELSDLFKMLSGDMCESLAKALGIELPLGGYKSVQEVLFDLLDGTEKIMGEDGTEKIMGEKTENMLTNVASIFGVIIAKLLITIVTGSKDIDWGELADKFKSVMKELP
jgi:hypothetical protein